MFASCLNSKSIFLSLLLWRRNSNAEALGLCACRAMRARFSYMHLLARTPIRGCAWERESHAGGRRERREREEKGTVREKREGDGAQDFPPGFSFTFFVMRSRSHIMLCFETNLPIGAFFFPFHLVDGDQSKCRCVSRAKTTEQSGA